MIDVVIGESWSCAEMTYREKVQRKLNSVRDSRYLGGGRDQTSRGRDQRKSVIRQKEARPEAVA